MNVYPSPVESIDVEPVDAAFTAAASELVTEARAKTETWTHEELEASAVTNQLVGMARHAQFMETTNRVLWLKTMQELKVSGEYKNVPLKNARGEMVRPKNFAELCEAMGSSRSKVDEDLQTLNVFGGTLLEEQKRLGISYPELRAMRAGMQALPADRQNEVKEIIDVAAKSGDKMELIAALNEMGVYNTRLSDELENAKEELTAKKTLLGEKSTKIDDLQTRLDRAVNPATEKDRQKNLREARKAVRQDVDKQCNELVGLVSTLCNGLVNALHADETRSDPDSAPVVDGDLWREVTERVALAWGAVSDLLARTGLETGAEELSEFEDGNTLEPDTEPETARQ